MKIKYEYNVGLIIGTAIFIGLLLATMYNATHSVETTLAFAFEMFVPLLCGFWIGTSRKRIVNDTKDIGDEKHE